MRIVTSAQWMSTNLIAATIDGQHFTVPDDPDNSDRRIIAAWESSGNTIAAVPGPTVAQLVVYANAKQVHVSAQTISVNIGTVEAPQNVAVALDALSRTYLDGIARQAEKNAAYETTWVDNVSPIITAAQILMIDDAVTVHTQASFAALADVLAAINAAPPTITTYSEIDVFAWPVS
jgi:hypothetical protein